MNIENNQEKSDNCKYRGVRKRKWGKYVSEIRLPNSRERIWLGSYDTAEKAARAFDAAMFCLRGHTARFNFPDNPPDIAGGRSFTRAQIQVAAARFAKSEPKRNESDQSNICELPMESSSVAPSPSLSEGTVLPLESPSPSLSEGTVQMDNDLTLNGSGLLTPTQLGNYASDYEIFPGFDDFTGDYYTPEMPPVGYEEENFDGLIIQDSFLWNFEGMWI